MNGWFEYLGLLGSVALPLVFVVVSLTFGELGQRRHLRQLEHDRQRLGHILVTNTGRPAGSGAKLLYGEAVVSAGYVRGLLAKFKKIFGGELRSYRTIMFRAREQALVTLLAQANAGGFDAVANVRLDPVDLANTTNNTSSPATYIAIVATGTAYRREPPADA